MFQVVFEDAVVLTEIRAPPMTQLVPSVAARARTGCTAAEGVPAKNQVSVWLITAPAPLEQFQAPFSRRARTPVPPEAHGFVAVQSEQYRSAPSVAEVRLPNVTL